MQSHSNSGVDVPGFGPEEKWRINRNILLLGVAFMVHFTAFHGAANLQSSVNSSASVGTFTLASIYGSLIVSNIFLPAAVIKWLGCKWTVAISFVAYMPFIAAQFYPTFYTLIPAGLMVGLGGGPLWCAKCTYLSVVAEPYSRLTGVPSEVLVVRLFGLFFMFYQLAQVWGNLISSSILSSSLFSPGTGEWEGNATAAPSLPSLVNHSAEYIANIGATCGANFCGAHEENPNLEPPAAGKIQLITGVYLACMLAAALCVACGVDSLTRYSGQRVVSGGGGDAAAASGCRLLAVTLRQLRHKYQLLLLPIIVFIGAEQAFMAADFTAAFVGCAWGIQNIGYVMICFGVCNALAAPVAGVVVRTTGRYPVMLAAMALHLGVMVALLWWRPHPTRPLLFFVLAALWGVADAVWLVQVNEEIVLADLSAQALHVGVMVALLWWRPHPARPLLFFLLAALWGAADAVWLVQVNEEIVLADLSAQALHVGVMVALLWWRPHPARPLLFFMLAALWGAADAVWLVQVNALSGILFPGEEEAAYSNFRLWEATGSVLMYAVSPYLCAGTKLHVLLALLLVGMAAYSGIELLEYRSKRAHHPERHFELVAKKPDE